VTARNAFVVPDGEAAALWRLAEVALDVIPVGASEIEGRRESALDYACLETFGAPLDEYIDVEGEEAVESLALDFLKVVQVENTHIWVWSYHDPAGVWENAYVMEALWDRPPLKTKGGFITMTESHELTPDQHAWRFFHLSLVSMLAK
jgi:hypothetical protein